MWCTGNIRRTWGTPATHYKIHLYRFSKVKNPVEFHLNKVLSTEKKLFPAVKFIKFEWEKYYDET